MTDRLTHPAEPRNRFLAKLPEAEFRRLRPTLSFLELPFEQVLYEADGAIDYVYFPTGSVLSALTVMQDGNLIEVATVGVEGLVGHYGSDGKTSPHRVVAQIAGGAYRMEARVLADEAAKSGHLRDLLAAYQVAFMTQVSQSVACNGLHRLEQRCCRWLLMSRDRCGTDDIRLTHDYLAIMLGARRASVTEVLRPLQEEGLVRSSRGQIRILDGAGLEERSCECYQVVRERYDRLLGTTSPASIPDPRSHQPRTLDPTAPTLGAVEPTARLDARVACEASGCDTRRVAGRIPRDRPPAVPHQPSLSWNPPTTPPPPTNQPPRPPSWPRPPAFDSCR